METIGAGNAGFPAESILHNMGLKYRREKDKHYFIPHYDLLRMLFIFVFGVWIVEEIDDFLTDETPENLEFNS